MIGIVYGGYSIIVIGIVGGKMGLDYSGKGFNCRCKKLVFYFLGNRELLIYGRVKRLEFCFSKIIFIVRWNMNLV